MRLGVLALALVALASGLAVVYAKHFNRVLYAELRELEKQRDQMDVEWGQLQLEQSTFARHSGIEAKAREQLGMVYPSDKDIQIVRR